MSVMDKWWPQRQDDHKGWQSCEGQGSCHFPHVILCLSSDKRHGVLPLAKPGPTEDHWRSSMFLWAFLRDILKMIHYCYITLGIHIDWSLPVFYLLLHINNSTLLPWVQLRHHLERALPWEASSEPPVLPAWRREGHKCSGRGAAWLSPEHR